MNNVSEKFTDSKKKKISALIFFLSLSYLMYFINSLRNGIPQSFVFFWMPILCLLISLVYQAYKFGNEKRWSGFIVFEITLVTFFFHIIYVVMSKDVLPGADDGYYTLASTQYIGSHADFITEGPVLAKWPLLQHLVIAISEICNIEMLDLARFLPSIYSAIGIIFIYLIAKAVYKDGRVALLAYLAFSVFFELGLTYSKLQPQSLAYIFFIACVFSYLTRSGTLMNWKYSFLLIFFMFCVILTHYTTTTFFIAFFVAILMAQLVRIPLTRFLKIPGLVGRENAPMIFNAVILAVVAWLGYWMFVGEPLFNMLVYSIRDLTGPSITYSPAVYTYVPTASPPLKDNIIGWGVSSYTLLFAIMMIYEVVFNRDCRHWADDFMFGFWAGYGFLIYLFLLSNTEPELGVSRIFLFLYPFILMVVCHIAIGFGHQWVRNLFLILLIGFMLLNVFRLDFVPSNQLEKTALPHGYGDWSQENAAIAWYPEYGAVACASSIRPAFFYSRSELIYTKQESQPYQGIDIFEQDMDKLKLFDWLYIKQSQPPFLSTSKEYTGRYTSPDEETLDALTETYWLDRTYSNGEWEIFHITEQR